MGNVLFRLGDEAGRRSGAEALDNVLFRLGDDDKVGRSSGVEALFTKLIRKAVDVGAGVVVLANILK